MSVVYNGLKIRRDLPRMLVCGMGLPNNEHTPKEPTRREDRSGEWARERQATRSGPQRVPQLEEERTVGLRQGHFVELHVRERVPVVGIPEEHHGLRIHRPRIHCPQIHWRRRRRRG